LILDGTPFSALLVVSLGPVEDDVIVIPVKALARLAMPFTLVSPEDEDLKHMTLDFLFCHCFM
jgi:hypothetical protein